MDKATFAGQQAILTLCSVMIRIYGERDEILRQFSEVMSLAIEQTDDAELSGLLTTCEGFVKATVAAIPE